MDAPLAVSVTVAPLHDTPFEGLVATVTTVGVVVTVAWVESTPAQP